MSQYKQIYILHYHAKIESLKMQGEAAKVANEIQHMNNSYPKFGQDFFQDISRQMEIIAEELQSLANE